MCGRKQHCGRPLTYCDVINIAGMWLKTGLVYIKIDRHINYDTLVRNLSVGSWPQCQWAAGHSANAPAAQKLSILEKIKSENFVGGSN